MAFTIRPLHTDEQKYTYRQSTQIEGQTGSIGYLRGDFGAGGKEFFSSWFDHRRNLKTDEFKSALDEVINALRSEEYGLLNSRTAMAQYAEKYPDSAFQGSYTTEYGFRADTEKHAFLIRCNPTRGDYNFYCYCYMREWLDRHIEKASRGIRFITPNYQERFTIPDGDKIRITLSDGEQFDRSTTSASLPSEWSRMEIPLFLCAPLCRSSAMYSCRQKTVLVLSKRAKADFTARTFREESPVKQTPL